MYHSLGGSPTFKVSNKTIVDTGNTHDTDLHYGSFLYFHHYPSGYYVTLVNRATYPIAGYSTNLVQIGGKGGI